MNKRLKEFISQIESSVKRKDSNSLIKIMEEESGFKAVLHGKIIGFGLYHYKYESGREGDGIVTGFSPGKQNITIYIMPGFSEYEKELEILGKHRTGKSCLYINNLAEVDEKILRKIIRNSVAVMSKRYKCNKT